MFIIVNETEEKNIKIELTNVEHGLAKIDIDMDIDGNKKVISEKNLVSDTTVPKV